MYFCTDDPVSYTHLDVYKRQWEGRWEVDGAMWLEADCNLTGGESLVRQIIKGERLSLIHI